MSFRYHTKKLHVLFRQIVVDKGQGVDARRIHVHPRPLDHAVAGNAAGADVVLLAEFNVPRRADGEDHVLVGHHLHFKVRMLPAEFRERLQEGLIAAVGFPRLGHACADKGRFAVGVARRQVKLQGLHAVRQIGLRLLQRRFDRRRSHADVIDQMEFSHSFPPDLTVLPGMLFNQIDVMTT